MPQFVIIRKLDNSVPSDQIIRKAMKESGGEVTAIEGGNTEKRVDFTGEVNHTVFENNLIEAGKGRRSSWEFQWAEMAEEAEEGVPALGAMAYQPSGNGQAPVQGLRATQYEVDVEIPSDSVRRLSELGFNLYAFKAVQAATTGGAPLVWFKLSPEDYSEKTTIDWRVQYQAYTSRSTIIPNGRVTATFSTNIDLGQTLTVERNRGGGGEVTTGGPRQAISILNQTEVEYTCGISQLVEGTPNPMCAFPLLGGNMDVIAPIEKILLMFSTTPVNTGTVIFQAYSEGLLIDLTSANTRSVRYEVNKGWSWGGFNWAQRVTANQNLVPLLIETPQVPSPAAAPMIETHSLVRG